MNNTTITILILFNLLASLTACSPNQLPKLTATSAVALTETPQPTSTITLSPTPRPTITPTPTLAPIGQIQPIPQGLVYLGDKKTLALGFNMNAGGSIGSLLYNGRELVDRTDYGRYIQLSFYDGNQKYEPLGNDPFGNWGWNPIQAGSKTLKGAKVLEYRTTEKGIYIKAYGKEWGENNVDSDMIFETWAWQHDTYFELYVRATHIGSDTHASAWQEFPATYFATSLTKQFGYFGDTPFTAQPIDNLHQLGNYSSCPTATPTENWVAFATEKGLGLILALPSQAYLTSDWNFCLFSHVSPPVGYTAPIAIFDNPPNAVHQVTFYLIPGPIDQGRSIVYDLIPHTTWTFDLNSLEGWHSTSAEDTVENGILTTHLSPGNFLTSNASLHVPGATAPTVNITARAQDAVTNICLYFLTANDPYWDVNKSSCAPVATGEFQTYRYDFKDNSIWNHSVITQFGLTASKPSVIDIDALAVKTNGLAWEFESDGNSEGWIAWNQITGLQVSQGKLIGQSTGNDPYMGSPKFAIDAKAFPIIKILMNVSSGNSAQLFFITSSDNTYDESKSLRFSVNGDGKFHTYTLDMSTISGWNGTITQIRLDPIETPSSFEVDYISIMQR
jgi:hypothetical protein